MTDIITGTVAYLSGAVICYIYATRKGVIWKEALLVATLSWAGLFILGMTDY